MHQQSDAPFHRVTVGSFWIDVAPITTGQFRAFVEATGYITAAEQPPDPKDYPGALPHMLNPGGPVFTPPRQRVALQDPRGQEDSYDTCASPVRVPRKVVKGGSHRCAPHYCCRYRRAAADAQPVDSGMSHLGFRCLVRA